MMRRQSGAGGWTAEQWRRKPSGHSALPWPTSSQRSAKRVAMDPALLTVTMILALVGLVMVFSASAVVAGTRFHDSWYFLKRQLAWLAGGLFVMHIVSRIDYTVWRKLGHPYSGSDAGVVDPGPGPLFRRGRQGGETMVTCGARFHIQPAEIAKFVLVIYVAAYSAKKNEKITQFARGLLPPLIVVGCSQRVGVAGAGFGNGRGHGIGHGDALVSERRKDEAFVDARSVRLAASS